MKVKVITDNLAEKIIVRWDDERFSLIQVSRDNKPSTNVVILNPREMRELVEFAIDKR